MSIMITEMVPNSWQDLQIEVALLLQQSGFDVEIEKKIKTSRSHVEVDVFAEEVVDGRKYMIICECKYWKNKIPQSTIHAFRTVAGDIGANKGYIISLNGFQSGAYNNASYTNIDLLTWNEFQDSIVRSWISNYFYPMIAEELDSLFSYTEPINSEISRKVSQLSPEKQYEFKKLYEKHYQFGMFVFSSYTNYLDKILGEKKLPDLPCDKLKHLDDIDLQYFPEGLLRVKSYRALLEVLLENGNKMTKEFDSIFYSS